MEEDEIMTEVRRNRAKLFEAAGGTLEGLVAKLMEDEKHETREIVTLPPRRPTGQTTGTSGNG